MYDTQLFDREELIALAKEDLSKQQVEGALAKLKAAEKLSDNVDEATGLLAKIYAQIKLFDRAKALFSKYLEHHPQAINERFQLGMVNLDNNDPQTAIAIWEPLLLEDNTHPPALYYSAVALLELNQAVKARRHLEVLLQTAASDNLYFNRAKELLMQIDHDTQANQPRMPDTGVVLNS